MFSAFQHYLVLVKDKKLNVFTSVISQKFTKMIAKVFFEVYHEYSKVHMNNFKCIYYPILNYTAQYILHMYFPCTHQQDRDTGILKYFKKLPHAPSQVIRYPHPRDNHYSDFITI